MDTMLAQHWLDYDFVALAVLLGGLGLAEPPGHFRHPGGSVRTSDCSQLWRHGDNLCCG
jgi:hypothetical protein